MLVAYKYNNIVMYGITAWCNKTFCGIGHLRMYIIIVHTESKHNTQKLSLISVYVLFYVQYTGIDM